MSFEARIFIQGVANYVPYQEEGNLKLDVLFPDQEKAGLGDEEVRGRKIRLHSAVIEMDSRQFQKNEDERRTQKKAWASIPIDGRTITLDVTFYTDPGQGMRFEPSDEAGSAADGFQVPGIPSLRRLWEYFGFEGLPADLTYASVDPSKLAGALRLEHGTLSPDSRGEGELVFRSRVGEEDVTVSGGVFTNLIKVELGCVESLALILSSPKYQTKLDVHPVGDQADVWIRHFCDVRKEPTFDQDVPCADIEEDVDFVLNYILYEDLFEGVQERLPIPEIPKGWIAGSPIGGACAQCCGTRP